LKLAASRRGNCERTARRAGIAPTQHAPHLTARILRGHAACLPRNGPPTPPAPPTARLSRRVLARTAARGERRACHGSCSRLSPHKARRRQEPRPAPRSAQHTTAVRQSSGQPPSPAPALPREASRRPAALPYRGLYAVARTRRASRPGTNQSQPSQPGAALPLLPLQEVSRRPAEQVLERRHTLRHHRLTPAQRAPPQTSALSRAVLRSSAPRRCAATALAPLPRLRAARTRSGSRAVMRAAHFRFAREAARPPSRLPLPTARPKVSSGGSQGPQKRRALARRRSGFFSVEREREE